MYPVVLLIPPLIAHAREVCVTRRIFELERMWIAGGAGFLPGVGFVGSNLAQYLHLYLFPPVSA